jgi:hypothetical protein
MEPGLDSSDGTVQRCGNLLVIEALLMEQNKSLAKLRPQVFEGKSDFPEQLQGIVLRRGRHCLVKIIYGLWSASALR